MLQDGQCAPRGSSESAEAVSLAPRQLVHSRSHFMVNRPARAPARQASMAARCGTSRSRASFLGLRWREIGRHAGQHQVGELAAEPVAVGAAIDLGGQRRRPLARALGQLGRRRCRTSVGRSPLAKATASRMRFSTTPAGLLGQPGAEQAAGQGERLVLQGVADARCRPCRRARGRTPARSGGTAPW